MPARLRSWTITRSRATAGRRGSEGSAGSGLRQVESPTFLWCRIKKTPDPLDSSRCSINFSASISLSLIFSPGQPALTGSRLSPSVVLALIGLRDGFAPPLAEEALLFLE